MKKTVQIFSFLMLGALISSLPASALAREVNKKVRLAPDGEVSLQNHKGSISIEAWERPEVEISARIERDPICGGGRRARKEVEDTEIDIDASPDSVRIKTDYGRMHLHVLRGHCLPLVHYKIRMPRTAQLHIKDHKSRIDVASLQSEVKIHTHKGTIAIAGIRGSLGLETHKGRGRISGLDGSLDLRTHKGELRVDFARLGGESRAETYKGEVELVVPKDARFDLDAQLGRGSLKSDFAPVRRSRSRYRREYRGPINGGGPPLRLRTRKGNFRLRQS